MLRPNFDLMESRKYIISIIAALIMFFTPVTVYADGDMFFPEEDAVNGWYPWHEGIGGARAGLTPENLEAVSDRLEAVAEVFRGSAALVNEAEISPSRATVTGKLPKGSHPQPAGYRMDMRIYRPGLKEARGSGGTISLLVNSPYATADFLFADAHGPIHVSRPVTDKTGSFPVHLLSAERARNREIGWVITPDGISPWLTVSRERWIRALIGDARGKLADFTREAKEEAPQRRAKFERGYEGMKKFSPENAEKMREQFETRENQMNQQVKALQAGDYDSLEKLGRRDLAMLARAGLSLEEELAAMPPGLRSAPAYCCEAPPAGYFAPPSYATRPSLLVEPDDKRGGALLSPNPDFFRSDLSKTAMQSFTIIQKINRVDSNWESYMEEVRRDIDWQALIRLLER